MPNKMNIKESSDVEVYFLLHLCMLNLEPYLAVQWIIVNVKASVQTAANIYY